MNKAWSEQKLRLLPELEKGEIFGAWDWSPDGKKLLGTFAERQVRTHVGYFSLETNRYEKVVNFGDIPVWLSDSIRFIFPSDGKAYLADIKTKRVREIFASGEEEIGGLGISNDGQLLYFTVPTSENNIWLLDLPE